MGISIRQQMALQLQTSPKGEVGKSANRERHQRQPLEINFRRFHLNSLLTIWSAKHRPH
jgi:hypothetical protein